jgi:hypothetical protein
MLRTADGVTWTGVTVSTMTGAEACRTISWDAANSLWIAGFSEGSNAKRLATSPNGMTWTIQTSPNTNSVGRIVTTAAGVSVAVSRTSTNKALRSTNGTTWAEVTLPASSTWSHITHSRGLGKWFASDGVANYATSLDGITWTTQAFTLGIDAGTGAPVGMASVGNIIYAADPIEGNLLMSEDGSRYTAVLRLGGFAPVANSWVTNHANGHPMFAVGNGTVQYFRQPLFLT